MNWTRNQQKVSSKKLGGCSGNFPGVFGVLGFFWNREDPLSNCYQRPTQKIWRLGWFSLKPLITQTDTFYQIFDNDFNFVNDKVRWNDKSEIRGFFCSISIKVVTKTNKFLAMTNKNSVFPKLCIAKKNLLCHKKCLNATNIPNLSSYLD
jgi:hypothetical protein